jgi:hypothetical protein
VTFTPIPAGTTEWDVPLNAALTDIDSRVTTNTTRIEQMVFNVKAYGAVGNNITNDTAAIQAAINAASAAGGGVVFFPPGNYPAAPTSSPALSVPSNVLLVGSGRRASSIRRHGNGVLIGISGPSTDDSGATHVRYSGIQSITLNGNSQTGAVLQCYYSDNHIFRDVYFTSSAGVLVDGVEFWDSRFYNCVFENSGGAADAILPNVHLRNSSASSGFGFSADTTNMILFDGCRWENFFNGALRVEQGTSNTNNPNGIYITNCKMETSQLRGGSHLHVADECRGVWVNGLYAFAGDFFSGYSTPQNIINWAPQGSQLENVLIGNGAVATISSGVLAFSGAGSTTILRNVVGRYSANPTGAHVFFDASSTADFHVEGVYSNTGTQFGGTIPSRWWNSPTKQVAGIPSDASFTNTPLNGTLAINSSTGDFYARVAGAWKQIVRSGTATLTAGTVTVATSAVTSNTRIQLTSQADGGTPGFLRVSARTAGVSFTITSSSATDTSTVAWQMTEPV